jgi:non-heme chloroperoxidase
MASTTELPTITGHEVGKITRANQSGLQPVVVVHGLWLLPNRWEDWAALFKQAGFVALAPGFIRRYV